MARTPNGVEDRREQIMDAAMQVFAQKGFARATNKDIAHAAGITPGLIYHYFTSKEDLLRAIVEENSPLAHLRTLSAPSHDIDVEALLRLIFEQALHIVEDEKFVQLIQLFLPEVVYNPALAPLGLTSLQALVDFLEQLLAAKIAQGALRQTDARLTAQTLVTMMMGFVLRRQVLRDPVLLQYSQAQIVDHLVATTLHGLLPG